MAQHSLDNINTLLPFQNLNDNEFETLNDPTIRQSYPDMDRLSQLRFIPFETNQNIAFSGNNADLDSSFNTNKIQCEYYLPEDFKKRIECENIQAKFSIMHLNIRRISNKFDSLKNLIDTLNIPFQKIGLTETWLNDNIVNCFTLNNYEYFGSNRPEKRGGGVGLYVSKQLEHKSRNDLTKNVGIIETKFIEIINDNGKNLIVGVIYRPPSGYFLTFKNTMNTILEKIDRENKICYLMGDFNIDLFKSESCDYAGQFAEQLFTSSFFPLITKATRITDDTATLIDNIFTNNLEKLNDSVNGVVFSDISDHLPIVHIFNSIILDKNRNTNETTVTYQREYNKANIESFKDAVKNISWNEVLNESNDSEKAYNEFLKLFMGVYEANFPLKRKEKKRKINKIKSPWMTRCILKSVKNKNKLYKTLLKNPNNKNRQKYTKYKNKLNHIIKIAKKIYYEEQFIKYKKNSKMMWKTLNELVNKPSKNIKVSKTFVESCSSNIIEDPNEIASKFNDYFINIGPTLANKTVISRGSVAVISQTFF